MTVKKQPLIKRENFSSASGEKNVSGDQRIVRRSETIGISRRA